MPSSHVEGQQPVSSGSQSSISRALADMLSPILSKRRDSGSKQPPVSPSTPCNPPKSSSQRVAAGTSPRLHPGKPSSILADLEDSYNRAPPSLTARAAFACPASPTTPAYHPVLNVSPSPSAISTDSGYISSMDSPRVSPGGAMTVFPALHRLLAAARICALPLPRTEPVAGTPNYPTTMLSLSSTVPAAMQRPNWCLADYAITDKLYEGYASNVLKGFCRQSGHLVVLKVYKLSAVCDLYKYQIFREVRLHSSLQHENVVTMFAAFQEGDSVVMIEEYADGADLFTVLQRYGGRLSERVAVQMVLDPFIRVLDYLHSRGIIHRDIKPENILFDKNMKLKLADFGLAIDLGEERAVTRAGTLDYMAPEVLKCPYKSRPNDNKDDSRLHYDGGVDSWAVGILAFELVVGCPPFYDKMRKHTEERILNMAVTVPQGVSAEARHFILSALSKDPANRLSVADMVSHPWIETLRNSSSTPRQQQQQQLRRSLQMHAMASSVGQPMDMSPQPSPRQPQLQPAPTALRSASTIRPNIAAAAKAALAAPATPRAVVVADKTQQPAQPAKPAAAEASTRSAAPSPRALAAAPSPSASPRDALSKLLDGKGSLEEYLQEQKRRQADKQKQQAAAKAAAIQALAAGASPGERLLAALGQRTARADGSVIMNVRHATAKLGVSGSKVTPPSGRPSILAQHAEAAAK